MVPSKHHLFIQISNNHCQFQNFKRVAPREALHLENSRPGYVKLVQYRFHSMEIINCQIDKYDSSAVNNQIYKDILPDDHERSALFNELYVEHSLISSVSFIRIIIQMIKSTKFVWMYLSLAALHCHSAFDKINLILNFPKEAPNRVTPCTAQTSIERKQTTSNDQTNNVQGLSTQSSQESMGRSEQKSRENENKDKRQYQGNAQQSSDDGNDESNGNENHQEKKRGDDKREDKQRDKSDESDELNEEEEIIEDDKDDEDQEEDLAEDEHQEEDSVNNQDDEEEKSTSNAAEGSTCLDLTSDRSDRSDTTEWARFLHEPLKVQGRTVWYPNPHEKRFTLHPHPHHGTRFGRPIPEMLKPSKSKYLSMERPLTSSGFISVDRILSEKAEARFKKTYEKKCKQQQDERINSIEDLPVSSEPYEVNLLDRKFYYNDDGTENLYDGPEETAAKLGMEYKGSPIITLYPSSTAMKQPSGPSSFLLRSPPKIETERTMPGNHKPKNADSPTRITLAAYKQERRRKALEHGQPQ